MDQNSNHQFRSALGRFATGVTIVTAIGQNDQPVGVTVNSFNSVSLDPPMVLWSLAKAARSVEDFSNAELFAVHILAADQRDLSNRFAKSGADKFEGIDIYGSNLPCLEGCAARFTCKTMFQHDGGDHIIFVGEVIEFEASEAEPLLYVGGQYAEARRTPSDASETIDLQTGRIGEQSIIHLLARAYTQIRRQLHTALDACDMAQPRLALMIAIAQHDHPPSDETLKRVRSNGFEADESDIDDLISLGWVENAQESLVQTDLGRRTYLVALSRMHAIEDVFTERFSQSELAELQHALSVIVQQTGDNAASLI